MRSATREALLAARAVLDEHAAKPGLHVGEQLLSACRTVEESAGLRSALADSAAPAEDKRALVARVFASFDPLARAVLESVAASRWSSADDLVDGIEELGLRSVAAAAGDATIESELFAFGRAVASDSELELALSSKLADPDAKVRLVGRLLEGKASEPTLAILRHLVRQPRGRRTAELLRRAVTVVADQAGLALATVTSAAPVAPAQIERLRKALAAKYGRDLRIDQVVDPGIVGGIRVQVGQDVIDGSVAAKLNELRLQLAG